MTQSILLPEDRAELREALEHAFIAGVTHCRRNWTPEQDKEYLAGLKEIAADYTRVALTPASPAASEAEDVVTQADRDAAANFYRSVGNEPHVYATLVGIGARPQDLLVQAFAKHRRASLASQPTPVSVPEGLREAFYDGFEACRKNFAISASPNTLAIVDHEWSKWHARSIAQQFQHVLEKGEEFVLVPREPTEAQQNAGISALSIGGGPAKVVGHIYRAMLATLPGQPS